MDGPWAATMSSRGNNLRGDGDAGAEEDAAAQRKQGAAETQERQQVQKQGQKQGQRETSSEL